MLDPRWIIVLALLELWALWAGHSLLGLACTFSLLCVAGIKLWQRNALRGVSYARHLGCERSQLGEIVTLRATFGNHKLLPLSVLEINDALPRHVELLGSSMRDSETGLACVHIARAMSPYARVTRHLQVRCARRGVHKFGPVRYRAGDFLGMTWQYGGDDTLNELVVLPKIFALELGPVAARQLIGAVRAPKQLLADPLNKLGAREYRTGDALRTVDWRASARRASLMVREIEASATPALQIVLNFSVHAPAGDRVEPDELEFAISLAASLAAFASAHGMAVGLSGNGLANGRLLALPASQAPEQVGRVLELLALANSRPSGPFADLLQSRDRSLQSASTWLVISDRLDARERAALRDTERRGRAVILAWTGSREDLPPLPASVRVLCASYQEGWSLRDALTLAA